MATAYFNDLINIINGTGSIVSNSSITRVGDFAFGSCKNLTSISLPNVVEVGDNSFYYCTRLKTISLPKLEKIGGRSFYFCTALTTINLPNVISIGSGAFSGCKNLKEIHFAISNKETIEKLDGYSSKFGVVDTATIYFDL